MRIVNVSASRRTFMYGTRTAGGCELNPGQSSAELPLERIFSNKLMLRDVGYHIIQLRLSEDDLGLLELVKSEHERKIVVAQHPKPKPKPKPKKAKPDPKTVKAAEKAKVDKMAAATPAVTETEVAGGMLSLADLQAGNKGRTQRAKITEIQTHMAGPMGSAIDGGRT